MISFRRFLSACKKVCLTASERQKHHPLAAAQPSAKGYPERVPSVSRDESKDTPFGVMNEEDIRLISVKEQKLFDAAKQIRLMPHEKVALKEAILAHADARPWWAFRLRSFSSVVAAVLIVTVTGSGMSYAAENSVPGDVLYPVKIYLNEEIRSRMMPSTKERILWEAKRAERRLHEAEVLSARGGVSADTIDRLEASFQKHANVVEAHLTTLRHEQRTTEAVALSATFNASLKARTHELKRNADTDHVGPLLRRVHSARVSMKEAEIEAGEREVPTARINKRAVIEMDLPMYRDTPETATMMAVEVADESEENAKIEARAASIMQAKTAIQASDTDDDFLIETEARLNIAVKKVQDIELTLPPSPSPVVSTTMRETKALLEQAKKAVQTGNIETANENVTEAMNLVRAVRVQMQTTAPAEKTETSTTPSHGSIDSTLRLQ